MSHENYASDAINSIGELKNDYDMTVPSRFVRRRKGVPYSGASADWNFRAEAKYYEAVEIARDMERNDAVIGPLLDRAVSNEVQEGFSLQINTPDKGFNEAVLERWDEWANDPEQCDIAGEMTFNEFELMASLAEKRDGDCLITCVNDGTLQFHESQYIGTNSRLEDVVLGVELDNHRRRVAYYLSTDFIDPMKMVNRGGFGASETRIPCRTPDGLRQAFHVYNSRRTTQTRGVTGLAPILQVSAMFEDVNFAKLVQQQIASAVVLLRTRTQFSGGMVNRVNYGEESQIGTVTGDVRTSDGVMAGMELTGAPGEDISAFTSNIPNAEYFQQVRLLLQLMGINFGLPLCLVLMDGSETNFSGWRGAVDEARKGFRLNQRNLIRRFHQPCYKIKLSHFLDEDKALRAAAAKMGKDAFKHIWHPQAWQYIEPVKDAQGDLLQVRNGLVSPRRIQAKNGRRWDVIARETIEDNMLAITKAKQAAEELNKEFEGDGQPVHWRELVSLPTPDGTQTGLIPPVTKTEETITVDDGEGPHQEEVDTASE